MLQKLLESFNHLVRGTPAPAYVLVRPDAARHCPGCGASYQPSDRYCPECRVRVPEWRFG